MSYKIVDQIKKLRGIPGKHKRVLEAWASFANKDGTGIRPSKEKVAERAGISRWTCYRHTADLLMAGILVADLNQDGSEKRHFYAHGHYTTYYHIDLAVLQDATLLKQKLCSKSAKSQCSKTAKSHVAKGDATIPIDPTASPLPKADPSAVSTAVVSQSVSESRTPPVLKSDSLGGLDEDDFDGLAPAFDESLVMDDPNPEARELLRKLKPIASPKDATEIPVCAEILALVPAHQHWWDLVEWNHAHKADGLYFREPQIMLDAMLTGSLVNQYETHDFDACQTCRRLGMVSTQTRRLREAAEQERWAQEVVRASERERWSHYDFRKSTTEENATFRKLREGWQPDEKEFIRLDTKAAGFRTQNQADKAVGASVIHLVQKNEPFEVGEWREVFADIVDAFQQGFFPVATYADLDDPTFDFS